MVTDGSLQHDRPDYTMVLKQTNEAYLVDIAIPGDSRLTQNTIGMTNTLLQFQTLRLVISIFKSIYFFCFSTNFGALGSISKDLPSYLDKLLLPSSLIRKFQQSVLYTTTSLLRRYLTV